MNEIVRTQRGVLCKCFITFTTIKFIHFKNENKTHILMFIKINHMNKPCTTFPNNQQCHTDSDMTADIL